MSATLIYHFKEQVGSKYVLEMTIHAVSDLERFPDGVRYSLIFVDLKTGDKLLMDNHHPKGHHIHLGSKELSYNYKNDVELVSDFKTYIFQHMGVKL